MSNKGMKIDVSTRKPLSDRVRALIRKATVLRAGGMTEREAAAAMGVPWRRAEDWRKRHRRFWGKCLTKAVKDAEAALQAMAPQERLALGRQLDRLGSVANRVLGNAPVLDEPLGDNPTLTHFFEVWYKPVKLFESPPKTIENYRCTLSVWRKILGDPPIREITGEMLATFRDWGLSAGRSPNTVRSHLRTLQTLLNKLGPAGRGNRDGLGLLERVPWTAPPRQVLTIPETVPLEHLTACYQAAAGMTVPVLNGIQPGDWWRALLVFVYNTGLRARTVFELPISAVGWDTAVLTVPPATLKQRRPQVLPLERIVLDHLQRIRTERTLLFPWPHHSRTFWVKLHRLQDLAAVPKFGLHGLRRTLATGLWAINPGAARMALGHTADAVTMNHYVSGPAVLAAAMGQLPQPFGG